MDTRSVPGRMAIAGWMQAAREISAANMVPSPICLCLCCPAGRLRLTPGFLSTAPTRAILRPPRLIALPTQPPHCELSSGDARAGPVGLAVGPADGAAVPRVPPQRRRRRRDHAVNGAARHVRRVSCCMTSRVPRCMTSHVSRCALRVMVHARCHAVLHASRTGFDFAGTSGSASVPWQTSHTSPSVVCLGAACACFCVWRREVCTVHARARAACARARACAWGL